MTNAEGEVTTTKYNNRFQTIEVKDALNQVYTFNYDPLGRMLSQTRAGGTMSFEYDNVGNRKKRTDYAGRVTNYTYDNLNRLTKIQYDLGTGNDVDKPQATYNYDDISRLTSAVNEAGTVSFNYDNRGRVINTTDVFGRLLEYEYERTPTVNQKRLKFEGTMYAVYNFDDAGRLASLVNSSDSTTTTFGYDNEDKITSRVFPNGVTTTYEYYNNDLLKRLKDVSTTATLFDRQYTYNSANQIGTITDLTNTRTYSYDNVDRLTGVAVGSPVESYTFDDVGNRTSSHLSATYGYQTGKFNQMTSTTTATMSYDANGSMVSKSEGSNLWRYTWDYENRLTRASTRKQNGRRVERNFDYGKERTKYTHDGLDVLVDDEYGTLTKHQNGPGIDNKLRAQTGSTVNYFLTDHLGSTNGLADSTGAITSQTAYDSFGNQTATLATRYAFTGRERDDFTGQMYYRARFYDAKLGRFTSEDPIGFGGRDINLYGYVLNQPLTFTDSFGLSPESDQQYWRAQQDLIEALAPAIRFGTGFGDSTLFGAPRYIRQWQGIDDPSLPCSASYQAGEWTAIAVQTAIGGVGLYRGGLALATRSVGPRVFWSGNKVALDAATNFAKSTGGTTLEMTAAGRAMTAANPWLPRWASNPLWKDLSSSFASGTRGSADVFHYSGGVRLASVWAGTEYPILSRNGVSIVYHTVFP